MAKAPAEQSGNGFLLLFKSGGLVLVILFVLFYVASSRTDTTQSTEPPAGIRVPVPTNPAETPAATEAATEAATAEVKEEEKTQALPKKTARSGPGIWLRGNFARFDLGSTVETPEGKKCKSHPVIGSMGVACEVSNDSPAFSVVFSLQYRWLEILRVMGSAAGEAEDQYKSTTMGAKENLPTQPSDARKFTTSFDFSVTRAKPGSAVYDEVRISLPPVEYEGPPKQGPAVYYFDIEVRDPKNVLKNASTCFITIGDWGNPQPFQAEVARTMERVAIDNWARFIVSTGDNFYPTGVRGPTDPQFQTKYERVYNTLPGLRDLQWILCAGNHDHWGLPGELKYGAKNPQWWFPSQLFTKKVPVGVKSTAKFIILDSYNRRNWKEQGAYLEKELNASSELQEWKMVVNHEPVYCGCNHGKSPDNKNMRRFWKPLFDQYVANAYFNGDDHTLQVSRSHNTDYFVSGGGGGSTGYVATRLPENQWYSPTPTFGIMLHCVTDNWGSGEETGKGRSGRGIMTTKLISKNGAVVYTHYTERK